MGTHPIFESDFDCLTEGIMPRPKKGIAGIKARKEKNENLARAGEKMQTDELAQLEDQFKQFKERLEHFAQHHRAEIQKNPDFRREFQAMCASIGVDPLSSSRGFWAEVL